MSTPYLPPPKASLPSTLSFPFPLKLIIGKRRVTRTEEELKRRSSYETNGFGKGRKKSGKERKIKE